MARTSTQEHESCIIIRSPKRGYKVADPTEGALYFGTRSFDEDIYPSSNVIAQAHLRNAIFAGCLRSDTAVYPIHQDIFSALLRIVAPKTEALEQEILDRSWKGLLNFRPVGDEQIEVSEPKYDFLE